MGTNYYLHTDVCPHCKRSAERVHIGKSSAGWPFLFRGYRDEFWLPDGVPHPIVSAVAWWAFLSDATQQGGRIVDEYGREHSLTELQSWVESKRDETRGPDSCNYRHGDRDNEWRDEDGHRFSSGEFS
jgi:hypothetical protein